MCQIYSNLVFLILIFSLSLSIECTFPVSSIGYSHPSYISLLMSVFSLPSFGGGEEEEGLAKGSGGDASLTLGEKISLPSGIATLVSNVFFLCLGFDFLASPSRLTDPSHPTVSLARSIFPARSLDLVALLSSLQPVTALCKVAALPSSCATVNKDLFN